MSLTKKQKVTESNSLDHEQPSTTLIQQHEQFQRLQRDFIAECPYEILYNILSQLDFDTASECLCVSRTWRSILSAIPLWRKTEFSYSGVRFDGEKSLIAFCFVSEQVEEAHFTCSSGFITRCIDILNDHKFPKLQSLKLKSTGCDSKLKIPMKMYKVLTRFKATLTELDLSTSSYDTPLSIRSILSRCPNLTALKIRACRIADRSKELKEPHKQLLSFEAAVVFFEGTHLIGIIKSLPNVRRMIINTDKTFSLLPDIFIHCPNLSIIGSEGTAFPHVKKRILQLPASSDEGLECVAFGSIFKIQTLVPVLSKFASTLKYLYIRIHRKAYEPPGWNSLLSVELPHLTELHLVLYNYERIINQVAPIMRHFPTLKVIHLANASARSPKPSVLTMIDDIFTALMTLENLSELYLNGFDICSETYIRLVERCLERNVFTIISFINLYDSPPEDIHLDTCIRSLEFSCLTELMDLINAHKYNPRMAPSAKFSMPPCLLRLTQKTVSDTASSDDKSKSSRTLYISGLKRHLKYLSEKLASSLKV